MALLVVATALAGCVDGRRAGLAASDGPSPLGDSRQVVLVVSDDWDATTAVLQCYARGAARGPWTPVGKPVNVTLGRTGLAWGLGRHDSSPPRAPNAMHRVWGPLPGPVKREGDGKSPAGVFDLPAAFGYAPKERAGGVKLPYLALTDDVVGVDDVKSKFYNRIVRVDRETVKDWDSQETMRRADGLYEWGVLVGHNTSPTVPGAGSCIFIHIWRGPGQPTAGCTAMSRDRVVGLVAWLDPQAKPVLVQLPRAAYRRLAGPWALPAFP